MKNRNVKVIDEHNIDRNANIMFALELEGSEYVVYWIERDQDSNNVFVSKVLRNIDGTFNMLNIDDSDKKKEISDIIKILVTNAVSDQNDKLVGLTTTLSNGKVVKFIDVFFNKEQNINVTKTYITTVKKEVTKVAEDYYDVIVEEAKVTDVLPSITPVVESVEDIFPEINVPVESVPSVGVENNVVLSQPEVQVVPSVIEPANVISTPEVVVPEQIIVQTPVVEQAPVVNAPAAVSVSEPSVMPSQVETIVTPTIVEPANVVSTPVDTSQTVSPEVSQPLVFNATSETNLNAALGEVANTTTIPVENIEPIREFGVDTPVSQPVTQQPSSQPVPQTPVVDNNNNGNVGNAGFANNKFFMVIAIAFFLASCIFLGYEVYNYFQLVK